MITLDPTTLTSTTLVNSNDVSETGTREDTTAYSNAEHSRARASSSSENGSPGSKLVLSKLKSVALTHAQAIVAGAASSTSSAGGSVGESPRKRGLSFTSTSSYTGTGTLGNNTTKQAAAATRVLASAAEVASEASFELFSDEQEENAFLQNIGKSTDV